MESAVTGASDRAALAPVAVADAVAVAAVGVLPLYLTAGLAVQIARDLGLSGGALGIASTAFFGAQAVTSPVVGSIVSRLGAARAMRLTAVLGALSAIGIGVFTQNLAVLVVGLCIGGINNALAQPATNQYIAEAVAASRQGSAFGMKQSAIPVASLLAGLSVPALGLTVGWRSTFVIFGVLMLLLAIRKPGGRRARVRPIPIRTDQPSISRPALTLLAVSSGIAAACGTSFGVFLVTGAVASGWSEAAAGVLFAGASVCGIAARTVTGVLADRRGRRHIAVVAWMMIIGAMGSLLLAVGNRPTYLVGAIVAYALGWGWPGLFIFAVVRLNPGRPAAATAFTQAGTAIGAVAGPAIFGLWVDHHSFNTAWAGVGIALVIAGLVSFLARRRIVRDLTGNDHADVDQRR